MKKTLIALIGSAALLAGCSGSSDPVRETVTHTVTADSDRQYDAMTRAWALTSEYDRGTMCGAWDRDPDFVKAILDELDDSTIERFYNNNC